MAMNGNQLGIEIDNAVQAIVPTLGNPLTPTQRLDLMKAIGNAIVSHIQTNATVAGSVFVSTTPTTAPFTGATVS